MCTTDVFMQIQQLCDAGEDEKIIELCVGQNSELSKEVAKNVMGQQANDQRNLKVIMSQLRRGVASWGKNKQQIKDLTKNEHVHEVKKKVNCVLTYLVNTAVFLF